MFKEIAAKMTFPPAEPEINHNKQKTLSATLHISGDFGLTLHPPNNIISLLSQPLQMLWNSL